MICLRLKIAVLLAAMASTAGCFSAELEDDDLDIPPDGGTAGTDSAAHDCGADAGVGQACHVGQGSCRRYGEYVCTATGVACNAEVVSSAGRQELCGTERDEDCDGVVDEAPDGRCCKDDDCNSGACAFVLAAEAATGTSSELEAQGGTCLEPEDTACSEQKPCASSDQECVAGRCEIRPVMRRQVGLLQSSGGGVMRGSGYVLQLRVGSAAPMGTMRGSGKVLRLGPPLLR